MLPNNPPVPPLIPCVIYWGFEEFPNKDDPCA